MGMRNLLILTYVTMSIWIPHLIYFWLSVLSLCIAPFMFNPHQFSYADFIIDYREFLRWMSRGNSRTKASSWYGYCRLSRTMITGYKKKKLGHPSEKLSGDVPRATWRTVIFSEVVWPVCVATIFVVAYMFVKSFPDKDGNQQPSPLLRILIIAVGPVVWNAAILISLFFVSLFLGPMMESWVKFGSVMASLAHVLCLVGLISFFEFFVCSFFTYLMAHLLISRSSGSLNFGTLHMPCLVSLPSSPSSVPSRNSLLRSSSPASLSTMRRIVLGGQVNGMAAVLETLLCPSLLVNSLSRLWRCRCGVQTSYLDTSYSSF